MEGRITDRKLVVINEIVGGNIRQHNDNVDSVNNLLFSSQISILSLEVLHTTDINSN